MAMPVYLPTPLWSRCSMYAAGWVGGRAACRCTSPLYVAEMQHVSGWQAEKPHASA